MTKEMEALFLKELKAEESRNRESLPSGIIYASGKRESHFSRKNPRLKKKSEK